MKRGLDMFDIYSLGEMVIDFIPGSEPASYIRKAGGAPANVAIAVSKNGLSASMCCKVGDDDFGRFLTKTMTDCVQKPTVCAKKMRMRPAFCYNFTNRACGACGKDPLKKEGRHLPCPPVRSA